MLKINKTKNLLGISLPGYLKTDRAGSVLKKVVQSKFETFWIKEINKVKMGPDLVDHNKLKGYKRYKGFFGLEPYLSKVNNRNQCCHLS